jgi:nitrogen fixation NifU-like protein
MSDPLAGLYQELILDHSRRRVGEGPLEHPDAEKFERNPSCGDEITVRIRLDESGTALESLAWEGTGCSISMASASALSELVAHEPIEKITPLIEAFRAMLRSRGADEGDEDLLGDAIAFAGVSKYVMRVKCAMLSWVALEACLAEVEKRPVA